VWAEGGFCTSLPAALVCDESAGVTSARSGQFITYNGMDYAVLDFTDPGEASVDCQGDYLPIPDGWQLAAASDDTEYAASSYSWGTDVVTTEHRGYNTALCPFCWPESQITVSNGNGEWMPNACYDRVFISRPSDATPAATATGKTGGFDDNYWDTPMTLR